MLSSYIKEAYFQVDFMWVVEHLMAPSPWVRGCDVDLPETVFLRENGKADFITRMEKDGCLAKMSN